MSDSGISASTKDASRLTQHLQDAMKQRVKGVGRAYGMTVAKIQHTLLIITRN